VAQDDYYYEIQLTNKQLVFYFMAGAVGLILSFLAGVMVGRGVDAATGEVQAARPPGQERIVAEEPPKPAGAEPAAEDLTYAQRLESERADESLEAPRRKQPVAAERPLVADLPPPAAKDPTRKKPAQKEPATTPAPATKPAAPKPEPPKPQPPAAAVKPAPAATEAPKPVRAAAGSFTIQVGAFKDKGTAESVAGRLKTRGYAAYLVSPEGGGLFNVRVGSYPARADAERVLVKLRDEEKFKPFIVKP
jgi:cell division protein FtsN